MDPLEKGRLTQCFGHDTDACIYLVKKSMNDHVKWLSRGEVHKEKLEE